ncbi:MAG: ABC-F family ATP-binding cassette domain-containing protein [Prevotellaceae bacterium]|jgi:ATP-binding cassette subfamily F protein uup|nr:ABC-F family ATP-binding cassette domain-containing protein [Prevotellaceae bacterium]
MVNILQIENLTKSYGSTMLFNGINFNIDEGEKIGLIGANGSGKTSLLNIVAGKTHPDSGRIVMPRQIRIGYLEQNPQYPGDLSVMQACLPSEIKTVHAGDEYENAIAYEQKIKQILTQLKISDCDQRISELSGGQVKRVALANVLINEPELLILDEPSNHLDLEMIEWLEEYLGRTRLSLLMVTHDRYFLERVCSEILELDDRQIYSYKGTYSYYVEKRRERIESKNAETERAKNLFRRELEWMRRQPSARGTKAAYRVNTFYELEEKLKQKTTRENLKLNVKSSYIGNKIFEAVHVCKSFGDTGILNDFNYVFSRYEKMGIVGSNGTGKSTFVKLLLGEIEPDSGYFDVGETVRFGYYSQSGLDFDGNMKVIDAVRNIAEFIDLGNGQKMSASQFLQLFMFSPDRQYNYISKLSGGERRRLYLCTVLMLNPNFLVLDEPTNDLDILTLNTLENYLQNFEGCLIVISHDRYFMDKTVDHLLAFEGNAEIKDFPGNYSDYRDWRSLAEREKVRDDKSSRSEKNEYRKPNKKKKLSFKERQEYEALEKEIGILEKEKHDIEQNISSVSDPGELYRQSERIAELIKTIDAKTERWMELDILNESLTGGKNV